LEEALAIYIESLSYSPSHWELRKAIGRTHRLLGNHRQSIQIFKDWLKSSPTSGRLNYELALSYYAGGNKNKALVHLETALVVWRNADETYESVINARLKWAEWNQVN